MTLPQYWNEYFFKEKFVNTCTISSFLCNIAPPIYGEDIKIESWTD